MEQDGRSPPRLRKILVLVLWSALILLCFLYRNEITVERIAGIASDGPFLAAGIMLALFALKSVSFFLYSGLLYIASGALFPLPAAIAVNAAGIVVMVSLPFFIGKRSGTGLVSRLAEKNPKLTILRDTPRTNPTFISFLVRTAGVFPCDLTSMYLGACGVPYRQYLAGSLMGLLPSALIFSVMGASIQDVTSLAFVISAGIEIVLAALSLVSYQMWKRRESGKRD